MALTTKQIRIMAIVCSGSNEPDEQWCDLDQILERLESEYHWHTSKQSLQFSIRALIVKHAFVEKDERQKRRGRLRAIIKPTQLGATAFGSPDTPPISL